MARPLLATIFRRSKVDSQSVIKHLQKVRSQQGLGQKPERLYQEAVRSLAGMVEAHGAALFLYHHASDQWALKATANHPPLLVALQSHSFFGQWLKGQFRSRKVMISKSDVLIDPRFEEDRAQLFKYYVELKAHVVILLHDPSRIIGFIALGMKKDGEDYDEQEYEAINWVAEELALLISHASLHEELMKKQSLLKDLNHLKGEFVSNITHDLSTPLNSILGMSQSLLDGDVGKLADDQHKCIEIINQSGERLRHLFETILDISQLEATSDQLHIQKINLHRLISDLLPGMAQRAKQRDTTIVMKVEEDVPNIYGDEGKIQLVMQKLLDNAVRYTEHGEVSINAERMGDRLQVEVSDTGVGIEPRYHDSIFEPFSMVNSGTTRDDAGSGLGLSVAKKIVEIHGGRMWLESRPQQGAHFYFTLPIKPADLRPPFRQ